MYKLCAETCNLLRFNSFLKREFLIIIVSNILETVEFKMNGIDTLDSLGLLIRLLHTVIDFQLF